VIEQIAVLFRRIPDWLGRDVIIPFAITRLSLCLVAWLAFHLWRPATTFSEAWQIGPDGNRHPVTTAVSADQHPFVNIWSRWDAGWYLEIARAGYSYQPGSPSTVAFFPLYPLLIRGLHALLFLPATDYWFLASGILLSNISLIIALIYFRALLTIDYPAETAARAILYLLVFPTSFFLSSVYAESLFLALIISAFFYARKNHWTMACALAGLATICRWQGILIVLPLLIEYLRRRDFNFRRIGWNILSFLLIAAALPGFPLYLHGKFGNWRVIFDAQQPWGRQLMWPWYTLSWVVHHSPPLSSEHHEWLDFSFLVVLVIGIATGLRQLRLSYSFYGWIAVVFFSSWGMLGSIPRFDLVVFPLFAMLGILGERSYVFHTAYVIIASMLAGLFMVVYSQWNWIA
jgi:Mannosyltransferase (PIG-V)